MLNWFAQPAAQLYEFTHPGQNAGQWVYYDPTTTFTFSIPSGFAIQSLWFPVLGSGGVKLYSGDSTSGTPFYTTGSSGSELVPLPSGITTLTMATVTGLGTVIPVFLTSLTFSPIRISPQASQVTQVTATAPIVSSGGSTPNISLTTPLAIAYGGTGTATPSLVQGTNVTITGTWPNQTINAASTTGVTNVTASAPLASSGGATPNISISGLIPIASGGTGTASPGETAGQSIAISGSWPNQQIAWIGNVLDTSGTLQPTGVAYAFTATTISGGLATVAAPAGTQILSASANVVDSTLGHNYFCSINTFGTGSVVFLVHDSGGSAIVGAVIRGVILAY